MHACTLFLSSAEMLRFRKVWRQSFPITEHNDANHNFGVCLSRPVVILPLLTEEFPVGYQVSFTKHRSRDWKIWRNMRVNGGSSSSWRGWSSCCWSRRRCAFAFVVRHAVFLRSICKVKSAIRPLRLTTTVLECTCNSLSVMKLCCYL